MKKKTVFKCVDGVCKMTSAKRKSALMATKKKKSKRKSNLRGVVCKYRVTAMSSGLKPKGYTRLTEAKAAARKLQTKRPDSKITIRRYCAKSKNAPQIQMEERWDCKYVGSKRRLPGSDRKNKRYNRWQCKQR